MDAVGRLSRQGGVPDSVADVAGGSSSFTAHDIALSTKLGDDAVHCLRMQLLRYQLLLHCSHLLLCHTQLMIERLDCLISLAHRCGEKMMPSCLSLGCTAHDVVWKHGVRRWSWRLRQPESVGALCGSWWL